MEQLRTLTALMDYARKIGTEMGPRKVAIALAEDVGVLESIEAARKEGFAFGILVGNIPFQLGNEIGDPLFREAEIEPASNRNPSMRFDLSAPLPAGWRWRRRLPRTDRRP